MSTNIPSLKRERIRKKPHSSFHICSEVSKSKRQCFSESKWADKHKHKYKENYEGFVLMTNITTEIKQIKKNIPARDTCTQTMDLEII